jgi:hypothetical protein
VEEGNNIRLLAERRALRRAGNEVKQQSWKRCVARVSSRRRSQRSEAKAKKLVDETKRGVHNLASLLQTQRRRKRGEVKRILRNDL